MKKTATMPMKRRARRSSMRRRLALRSTMVAMSKDAEWGMALQAVAGDQEEGPRTLSQGSISTQLEWRTVGFILVVDLKSKVVREDLTYPDEINQMDNCEKSIDL